MATYNKFQDFVEALGLGEHNLNTGTLKCYLSNTAPDAAADADKADLAEFAGGTGYTAGGEDTQNSWAEAAGTATLTGTAITWTAGAADWVAFRYVVLYNDTHATDGLISWWDYGGGLTLGNGETFTIKFNGSAGAGTIFTLA